MPSPVPIEPLRAGTIEIDTDRSRVLVRGTPVNLSTKELKLLKLLIEGKGGVVSRDYLLEKIWDYGEPSQIGTRTVDVYVHRLRQKFGSEGRRIITVKNVGYRFDISFEWINFGA